MAGLSEATMEILRTLARSVALHRREGGVLDTLPPQHQELLRAMDEAQRQFFMKELAKMDAQQGKNRFRAMLGRWRARHADADPIEDVS